LYTAVNGLPDISLLNDESKTVLYKTYGDLMKQVENDATPEFLNELKSKICAGHDETSNSRVEKLSEVFEDKTLNPFDLPFEYLLNGELPDEQKKENLTQNALKIHNLSSPKKE
jgi:hypothetical protein